MRQRKECVNPDKQWTLRVKQDLHSRKAMLYKWWNWNTTESRHADGIVALHTIQFFCLSIKADHSRRLQPTGIHLLPVILIPEHRLLRFSRCTTHHKTLSPSTHLRDPVDFMFLQSKWG
ncbi:hypothetical protein AVEN_4327-1 [Araneus ventricosus]|uniref:Uncharacterized protein n=1 Tax=Araneus ventricosus TaxID=182803 RepID=A0A4Y2KY22_ARAVE|nr:hypothetical protein AVEN_4327-1 [Araneus ventricosus]